MRKNNVIETTPQTYPDTAVRRRIEVQGVPTRIAEALTGHSRGGSDFDHDGTVGYTLEQKLAVIRRVAL
jgi:hypothetical protein